jgi:hypothetical protein
MSTFIDPHQKNMSAVGVSVIVYTSDVDGVTVVQVSTSQPGRLRINLNDADIWDGDPEVHEQPGPYHSSKER